MEISWKKPPQKVYQHFIKYSLKQPVRLIEKHDDDNSKHFTFKLCDLPHHVNIAEPQQNNIPYHNNQPPSIMNII